MQKNLILPVEKCTAGVEIVDFGAAEQDAPGVTKLDYRAKGWWFRNRSDEVYPSPPVERGDLSDSLVQRFVNAQTDEQDIEFFKDFGLPQGGEIIEGSRKGVSRANVARQKLCFVDLLRDLKRDPAKVVKTIEERFDQIGAARLSPVLRTEKGKLQFCLKAHGLYTFMLTEVMFMAVGNVRLSNCKKCGNFFVTGSQTKRTKKAEFCSPRCRVASVRARQAMECVEENPTL